MEQMKQNVNVRLTCCAIVTIIILGMPHSNKVIPPKKFAGFLSILFSSKK